MNTIDHESHVPRKSMGENILAKYGTKNAHTITSEESAAYTAQYTFTSAAMTIEHPFTGSANIMNYIKCLELQKTIPVSRYKNHGLFYLF